MIKLHTHNTPCPPWKRRSREWTISMLLVWAAFSYLFVEEREASWEQGITNSDFNTLLAVPGDS